MDDVSMDTTSDDELDFNTPLWKRNNRRQDGKELLFASHARPFFEKTHDTLKKASRTSGSSGTADGVAFGERGSPLSEVTGNISRGPLSPPFSGRLTLDEGNPFATSADYKATVSVNRGTSSDVRADSYRTHERQESTKHRFSGMEQLGKTELASGEGASRLLEHLNKKSNIETQSEITCRFATERAETSRKQMPVETSSTLSSSPGKGGWRKLETSPLENSRKLLNSPLSPGRQISPKRSPTGSSVHIHWDKNKQMKSTSLEPRTSCQFSPSKLQTHSSSSPSHRSSSVFSMRSPVLILDTPEWDRKHDGKNSRSTCKKSLQVHLSKSHRNNLMLNELLSEGDLNSSKDLHSSSTSSQHLFSPGSPSSRQKSSGSMFHSPTRKFTDFGLEKQEGSSEKNVGRGRDPVWDFAETFSSPEKRASDFSRKFDHRRRRDRDHPRDVSYLKKMTSPDKDLSRKYQQRCSATSEDDDLPLISLVTNKSKTNLHHKSPTDSSKSKYDALVTSPSRAWSSPPKTRPWVSPSRSSTPAGVVISPWRPQTAGGSVISSRTETWKEERQSKESTSRNSSRTRTKEEIKEARVAARRAAIAMQEAKKNKLKKLLAVFSSDEDEDAHPFADKKRKNVDNAIARMDEAAKRRKTNLPSPKDDCFGSEGSRKQESSVRSKDKDTSSIQSSVNDYQGIGLDRNESSDVSRNLRTGGHNVSSTRTRISGRMKDSYHSSSASHIRSSSTASSLLYSNHGSAPTTATSSKPYANPSHETSSSHRSSNESVHSKNSKGKGKKQGKSPTGSASREDHMRSSAKCHSLEASDLPSSSGISGDTMNMVKDDSDDEVVMVDSFSYASSLVGAYGKTRKSHKKKEAKASSTGPLSSGATGSVEDERNTVSPSLLQQLNQMDSDEAMARRMQEEFDAEMARSVQQHGPPQRPTEDTNPQAEPRASCSVNVRGADRPDAGTFGTFNPHHNISIEVSSDVPVQIGSFNWNYDFQPASSLLDRPDRPPAPPSPPPPVPRRGRPTRQRGRRRSSNDRLDEVIPDLADPRGHPHDRHRPNMEMIWNLHHDLVPGTDLRWMPYPYFENINPPPRPGRQQGRGRGRARGRRRDVGAGQNDGNDYDALLQLADSLGPAVDKRLTQASIDRLPTFKFSKERHSGSQEENACPVCMDDYDEEVELRRLPCFHVYHKKCIDMWLNKNQDPVCPICRVEVKIE